MQSQYNSVKYFVGIKNQMCRDVVIDAFMMMSAVTCQSAFTTKREVIRSHNKFRMFKNFYNHVVFYTACLPKSCWDEEWVEV